MYLTAPCSLHNRSVEWLADPWQEEELEGAQPAGDWSQNIGTVHSLDHKIRIQLSTMMR
jgi:hypothetical protein